MDPPLSLRQEAADRGKVRGGNGAGRAGVDDSALTVVFVGVRVRVMARERVPFA